MLVSLIQDNARLEVKVTTPRASMTYKTLAIRMASFYQELAVELGVLEAYVDNAIAEFAFISAAVVTATGLDFELANLGDDVATLRRKFLAYLDTEFSLLLDQVRVTVNLLDAPAPPSQRPSLPADAPKN